MDKISHIYNNGDWHIQFNNEHCKNVAQMTSAYASEFGMSEWGRLIGLLHDRGKESDGFQSYIRRNSGYDTEARPYYKKEHSYIGAVLAHRLPGDMLYWLSNAIAGHHRGLYNTDELELILKESVPNEVSRDIPDVKLSAPRMKFNEASHIGRMLYSCLVDADRLDTERFMSPESYNMRSGFSTLAKLDHMLDEYIQKLRDLSASPINTVRNDIQDKCITASLLEPGFFELTVPTGGGKTIASVLWAIKHAVRYNKKRIIIAIPYTSIIVQTATILKKIFGEENVIEHHSVMDETNISERSLAACDNWDAPIIVTTNVQLFESMFSNKPSSCRKLHSIVNSVVVLDEVQNIPLAFLQPIVNAMNTYVRLFGVSFLMCTASQIIIDGVFSRGGRVLFLGIEKNDIRTIVDKDMCLNDRLRRVNIKIDKTSYTYSTLSDVLRKHKRVLCIVNTRQYAEELYKELSKDTDVLTICLSRNMCEEHILERLEEIKHTLLETDTPIRVVSTQLIEAGVDIDFPVVYRQLSGLDSIVQSAGRCNREGHLEIGCTTVFSFAGETQPIYLRAPVSVMSDMILCYPDIDWTAPETMRLYYEKLYNRTSIFDQHGILQLLDTPMNCQYEKASEQFRMIDESGTDVIINYKHSDDLVKELIDKGPSRELFRKLGRFIVNVPDAVFDAFRQAGIVTEPIMGMYYISSQEQYDDKTGLLSEPIINNKPLII